MSKVPNAFHCLSLEPTFTLDAADLEARYLRESAKWHPDQHPQASSREKLDLTIKTADLNEAYETLKDPLRRGYHLLHIFAPHLEADAEKTIKDPALLREAMEDQEYIDEVTSRGDIEYFVKTLSSRTEATLETIRNAFAEHDYTVALQYLYRYRYYDKVRQDAAKKAAQLSNV